MSVDDPAPTEPVSVRLDVDEVGAELIERRRLPGYLGIIAVDGEGVIRYASVSLESMLGIPMTEAVGRNFVEFLHPDDVGQAIESFGGVAERAGHHQALELRVLGATVVAVNVVADNQMESPGIGLVLINIGDPADRRRSARILEAQAAVVHEVALGNSLDQSLVAIASFVEQVLPGFAVAMYTSSGDRPVLITTDASREIGRRMSADIQSESGHVVARVERLLPGAVAVRDEEIVIADDIHDPMWSAAVEVLQEAWGSIWSIPIRHGRGDPVRGLIEVYGPHPAHPTDEDWALLDLASRMAAIALDHRSMRDRMERDASVDPLTGCPNRRRLIAELDRLIDAGARGAVVGFIDLDRLKVVNDALGHEAGDVVIRESAERLNAAVGTDAIVGRFGGDEFVVIAGRGVLEPGELARRCLGAFATPVRSGDRVWQMSASVGVVVVDDQTSPGDVLRDADTAMYEAKQAGRNTWRRFNPADRDSAVVRLQLEQSLRRAVSGGHIAAWFQPVVRASDWTFVGAEGLARWQPTPGEFVPPDRFIPLAAELGLLDELGCQMVDFGLGAVRRLTDAGCAPRKVSVNMSPVQLQTEALFEHLDAMNRAGRPVDRLCLEMTEEHIVDDNEWTNAQLARLLRAGASLAVDDFGTGYSSLAALHRLPISILKIDRGLVAQGHTEAGRAVLTASVAVARAYGLTVVGEGVETVLEAAVLRDVGVDLLQGYLFARPAPLDELVQRVTSRGWMWDVDERELVTAVAAQAG
jgi:diguanylate cyclase (GGDEF)-like protein